MSGFDDFLDTVAPGGGSENDPIVPRALELEPRGVIGRGGTGVVYKAHDPVLDRLVAVKISRPSEGARARESMLAEARLTASLRHPCVVPIYRVVAADGLLCIISELAPERTLQHLLDEAREGQGSDLDDRLRVLDGVASALEAAHALGVVHGDLHPGNVAIGTTGNPLVLDWGLQHDPGTVSGSPGWLAPERLQGDPPTKESDVFGLGLLLWALTTLRYPRPRSRGESLGEYVARWADAPAPTLDGLPLDLAELCLGALSPEPADRPTAPGFRQTLAAYRSGRAVKQRRRQEAKDLLEEARSALHRYQQLGRRIVEERTVVVIQRSKVPGHAPVLQKRELWAAEDRVRALEQQRAHAWVLATEAATRVLTLAPDRDPSEPEANRVLARLWWERMEEAEAERKPIEARVAERWVRRYDTGPLIRALDQPAELDLVCDTPGAVAHIHRFEEQGRVLTPVLERTVALPFEREKLPPGSWLLVVEAEGKVPARLHVSLDRLEHLQTEVRLYTAEEIGEGWVHVPAGRFFLGGDPRARQPLDPCRPWLPDLFFTRTCVRSGEWLEFLNDLDPAKAEEHVPGESGFMGTSGRRYWHHDGEQWQVPPGWNLDWPVFSVNSEDMARYCDWRSEQEGRRVRLPTEEEWEKASRGVDGRSYPWGEHFDPTFAHMRQSRPGPPRPHPVADYPVDTSVYGLRDTAGGMRELTQTHFDVGQLVIRGGTWGDDADDLRCANRAGLQPDFRYSFISFRLVTEAPRPT